MAAVPLPLLPERRARAKNLPTPFPSPPPFPILILPLCPFSLFPLHINRVCLYANATNHPLLDNLTIRYTIGRRSFPLARFGEREGNWPRNRTRNLSNFYAIPGSRDNRDIIIVGNKKERRNFVCIPLREEPTLSDLQIILVSQLSKRVFPLCNLYICIYSLTNNFFLLFLLYSNTREKGKSRNNGEIRENWVTSTKGREC